MEPTRAKCWPIKALTLVIVTACFTFILTSSASAEPADWGESDWYKFIEMSVSVGLDKLHGGIEGVPRWMNQKPVNGRLPLLDAYAALSAAGSSVKPGLTLWLHSKMREAKNAEDWDRLDGYQAYETALSTGNQGPLRRFLKERVSRARGEGKGKGKGTAPVTLPTLVLNSLLASANSSGKVEVVPQFTVGGNQDNSINKVSAQAMVRGPATSFIQSVEVPLAQPTGYQAAQIFLQLPPKSPSGRYTVGLSLSDSRGLSTELKKASFDYTAPTRPGEPPTKEKPPTREEPPVVDKDPPRSTGPEKAPEKSPESVSPDLPRLRVVLSAPTTTPVGRVVTLSSRVEGGSPPYTYSWSTDGKHWPSKSVTLDYDTPGTKSVDLLVTDNDGNQARASSVVRVTEGIAVNIAGPRKIEMGKAVSYSPVVVTGPSSGFFFSWSVDGQTGVGETFTPIFTTAGPKTLTCTAKHPDHPAYRSTAFITVEESSSDPVPGPLSVKIIGPTQLKQGEAAAFYPSVKGGVPPYRYLWTAMGKNFPQKQILERFDKPGERMVVLEVSDSAGGESQVATASLRVNVAESKDLTVKILGPTRVKAGETVTFAPSVSGGTGPYRYVWTVQGLTTEKKTIQGSFEDEGSEKVKLAVYDRDSASAIPMTASIVVTVTREASSAKSPSTASRPNQKREPRPETKQGSPLTLEDLAGGTYLVYFEGKPRYYYRFTSERHKTPLNYICYWKGLTDSKWTLATYRVDQSGVVINGLVGQTEGNARSFTRRFMPYSGTRLQTFKYVRQ